MIKLMIISLIFFVCANFISFASSSSPKNLCSNGGFEVLANGFPDNWGGFGENGTYVGVSMDAHSGKYSLHLKRSSDAMVGVNVNNDALIPLRRGIVHCWYKAISSETGGKNLQICIIGFPDNR